MNTGKIAFALSLGGLVLAILLASLAGLMHLNAIMPAFFLFAGFQLAALVLGFQSRREVWGKSASILSSVLLLVSLGFL